MKKLVCFITNIAPRTHRGWLEVSRAKRGEFGKLPATRGAFNPGLTEPANTFGFYPIHRAIHTFVALHDIFVHVLSTFSGQKYRWALNTSLSTSSLPLLHFSFGYILQSQYRFSHRKKFFKV
jgi:hypothetical protein